jgi:hypothetical protein
MSTDSQVTSTDEEQSEKGTLDEVLEWRLPEGARVPDGATFFEGADDGFCRVIHPGDRGRCQGVRMRETGLCPPHGGRSRILEDPRGMQARGAQGKVRARERRALLEKNGITPRLAAREAAIARADAVARALVDDVLDDSSLSTTQRHRAVLASVEALFPLIHAEIEVEIPADPEGMTWADMQRLALQLSGAQGE